MEKEFKIKILNPMNEEDILTFTTSKYIISANTISFNDRNGKFFEYPLILFRGVEENKRNGDEKEWK